MPLVYSDFTKSATTTTGTGNLVETGSITGYHSLSDVLSDGDVFVATIKHQSANQWERSVCTWINATTEFSRDLVLSNSLGNTSAINFSAGTKYVYLSQGAEHAEAVLYFIPPSGRLTLESNVAVSTSNQTGKTTVYFTPYEGNSICLWNGYYWQRYTLSEISVSVPATTVTPFDVFLYDNAGTLTLETVNWTNDTTRATAITLFQGQYVKNGSNTHLLLGTCRTTSVSGQCEDSLTKRFVNNVFNKVPRKMFVDKANLHTYDSATVRPWDNDTALRFEWVQPFNNLSIFFTFFGQSRGDVASYSNRTSIGIDSTTAMSVIYVDNPTTSFFSMYGSFQSDPLAVGYHYCQILQQAGAGTIGHFAVATAGAALLA